MGRRRTGQDQTSLETLLCEHTGTCVCHLAVFRTLSSFHVTCKSLGMRLSFPSPFASNTSFPDYHSFGKNLNRFSVQNLCCSFRENPMFSKAVRQNHEWRLGLPVSSFQFGQYCMEVGYRTSLITSRGTINFRPYLPAGTK